jgi:hypothetical protein
MGRLAASLALALLASPSAGLAQVRVPGLNGTEPARISIYTVRGPGVSTPLIAFQERARQVLEAHVDIEIVSMDEMLARGGAALQRKLAGCQGEPRCFASLLGRTVDANQLLLITATLVGDVRLVGARLIDLAEQRTLGEAIDPVPGDATFLDALPERIRASVPAERWDPFGTLELGASTPGARLEVAGRVVGMSPLGPLPYLLPGEYEVAATKDGFLPSAAKVAVRRGEVTRVGLELVERREEGGRGWLVWTGLGVLAAGAAVAGALLAGADAGEPTFCSATSASACR